MLGGTACAGQAGSAKGDDGVRRRVETLSELRVVTSHGFPPVLFNRFSEKCVVVSQVAVGDILDACRSILSFDGKTSPQLIVPNLFPDCSAKQQHSLRRMHAQLTNGGGNLNNKVAFATTCKICWR